MVHLFGYFQIHCIDVWGALVRSALKHVDSGIRNRETGFGIVLGLFARAQSMTRLKKGQQRGKDAVTAI